jgi:hypothetical protein
VTRPKIKQGKIRCEHLPEDEWLVFDNLTLVYGTGPTPLDAWQDYAESLLEWVEIQRKAEVSEWKP